MDRLDYSNARESESLVRSAHLCLSPKALALIFFLVHLQLPSLDEIEEIEEAEANSHIFGDEDEETDDHPDSGTLNALADTLDVVSQVFDRILPTSFHHTFFAYSWPFFSNRESMISLTLRMTLMGVLRRTFKRKKRTTKPRRRTMKTRICLNLPMPPTRMQSLTTHPWPNLCRTILLKAIPPQRLMPAETRPVSFSYYSISSHFLPTGDKVEDEEGLPGGMVGGILCPPSPPFDCHFFKQGFCWRQPECRGKGRTEGRG